MRSPKPARAENPLGNTRRSAKAYLYLLPAFAVLAVFVVYPILMTLRMGFYQSYVYLTDTGTGFGLNSFRYVLQDPAFGLAVRNTMFIVLVGVPITIVLSLGAALLINSLLRKEHLSDGKCNSLCAMFAESDAVQNGVIVHSDLLLNYLKRTYPNLYFVSSTTKVLTDFQQFVEEVNREEFRYVVPDFRLNKSLRQLDTLTESQKVKVEFLCNECCWSGCKERKQCYEVVSRQNLGEDCPDHRCAAPDGTEGYQFSKAMENPEFIGIQDIKNTYLPMGFTNFKIEGRGLGSALILEFLLYYMTKPEYQIHVREKVYLDNMLDLF